MWPLRTHLPFYTATTPQTPFLYTNVSKLHCLHTTIARFYGVLPSTQYSSSSASTMSKRSTCSLHFHTQAELCQVIEQARYLMRYFCTFLVIKYIQKYILFFLQEASR